MTLFCYVALEKFKYVRLDYLLFEFLMDGFKSIKFNKEITRNIILHIYPCSRVIEAAACKVIVLPVVGDDIGVPLRKQDQSWKDFLSSGSQYPRYCTVSISLLCNLIEL